MYYTPIPYHLYADKALQSRILRESLEYAVVLRLHKLFADQSLAVERMQEIASLTLKAFAPDTSVEQLYTAMIQLASECPEIAPSVTDFLRNYEVRIQKKLLR